MNASQETRTLWVAVFAGLMAMFLLYSYTNEKTASLTKKFGSKKFVVIASKDIQEMQTLNEDMLQVVERPVDFIQPNAISNPETVVGHIALAPLRKGEQILPNKLSPPDATTGLSLQVTPGLRALTVPVDDVRGVAKLIKPGDRVDVLAAIDVGTGFKKKKYIKTILQNIPVLATGVRISNQLPAISEQRNKGGVQVYPLRGDTKFSHITLELTPSRAQKIAYIISTSPSSLFFTLRHPTDTAIKILSNTSQDTLLDRTSFKKLTKSQSRKISSQIFKPAQIKPKTRKKKKKPVQKGSFIDL